MPEHVYETDVAYEPFWEELKLYSRWEKLAFVVTFSGTVSCLVISFYETFSAISGPRMRDVKHGLVVPFSNHGEIHYISQTRSDWLNTSFALYFPFFLALGLLMARARLRSKKAKD